MRALSLRSRILLLSGALVALLTALMLAYVSVQANRFVGERLLQDLQRARELAQSAERERLDRLLLTAELVASYPELKALLENTDAATLRDFLLDYRGGADLLVVLDPQGRVLARTDAFEGAGIPDVQARWIRPALEGRRAAGLLRLGPTLYHAALAPAAAAGTVFGFVLAGAPLDERYASELREPARSEIVLIGAEGVLGATLRRDQWPWSTTADWQQAFGTSQGPHAVTAGGEDYVAMSAAATDASPLTLVVLESRDRALAPYHRIQAGLIVLGLLAIVAGLAGSAALARSVTAPVNRLRDGVRKVAAGDLDVQIDVPRRDEIGELAVAFNQMTRGLRERADMQRFVSQSTVEMIQAGPRRVAGERRVITVLFSDIRGFTTWAERRPPEDAVRLLNECFSAQAALVRRFSGDIDKYVGDALFAHFGGDDMALNAIRCAVEMHRTMTRLADAEAHHLALGIGIVTGEVLIGSIGSEDRQDYTAIGSNVNLCERLCSRAAAGEILMSESTWQAVRDLIAAEPVEGIAVKGFSEPVRAYRISVRQAQ